ncbi:MAG: aminopeptidase P family protein [Gracilibacteraceae bacterium]|jgi:Xaa-Pro aminopeptidase|nr:aminopeptidase P family protein [Gracilibacteraceae bacterium]
MNDYRQRRLTLLRERMRAGGVDAVLAESAANVFYLSGFSGESASLLITAAEQYLLTDARYTLRAQAEAEGTIVIDAGKNRYGVAATAALVPPEAVWGLEEEVLTLARYAAWRQAFPRAGEKHFSAELAAGRQIKDAEELAILRRGVAATDDAFRYIIGEMGAGVTENAIARRLEYFLRDHGASGPAFPFIVVSGTRGATPHGTPTDKALAVGDLTVMDFGGVFAGYHSDFTRTVCVGRAGAQAREIYAVTLEAQLAGIAALRPGVSCREADAAAREVIKRAGYGDYFTHSLGHSLGLEIHESPSLSSADATLLAAGMVVTVEPGIYIPGFGGVRIEDVALITANGAEVLTAAPKELIIV